MNRMMTAMLLTLLLLAGIVALYALEASDPCDKITAKAEHAQCVIKINYP